MTAWTRHYSLTQLKDGELLMSGAQRLVLVARVNWNGRPSAGNIRRPSRKADIRASIKVAS